MFLPIFFQLSTVFCQHLSSNHAEVYNFIMQVNCMKRTKINEKRPVVAHSKNVFFVSSRSLEK